MTSEITHITPVGGNVFADLGFEPEVAAKLLAANDRNAIGTISENNLNDVV